MNEDLHLLPRPQRLTRLEGTFRPEPERLIWLAGENPADLLGAGRAVQDALAAISSGGRWALTAAGLDGRHVGAVVRVDPYLVSRREGYHLTIQPTGVHIAAHDGAGAFYAAMTLRQIARQATDGALPCLRIEDWPDFSHRGVMLDISRDKVPQMDTLYGLVDMLAEWKINQFQLYMEHTFAYRDHREVWANASPVTSEEILALDAYCRARFIELVPNQNSFGHMTRWLQHPRYTPLAETQAGFRYPWGEWEDQPYSLCPLDPGSLELMAALYEELLPHFSSRLFNIGCDEVFDLGQPGTRSKEACDARGKERVYLDFVRQLCRQVHKHGRTVQIWADVVLGKPDLLPELPEGVIAVDWGYEADYPFAHNGALLAGAGVPFYVCGGTSSWSTIAGRTENALGNLSNAAENGLAHGALGFLTADWGDRGHWQPLPISFLGLAYGAAMSWAVASNRDLDLPRALDLHAFADEAGVMGKLAYDLGNTYKETGVLVPNSSALFWLLQFPDRALDAAWVAGLTVEALKRTEAYIERVMEPLARARMARPDAPLIGDEFRLAADLLRHACRLGVARLEAENQAVAAIPLERRRALAQELEGLVAEYRRLWLARNRPGGLDDSAGRLEKLLALYRA